MKAHVRRGWVRLGLQALGLGGDGAPPPAEPARDPDLTATQQRVRHLLHEVVGSTTGRRALNTIERVTGRRAMVLFLSTEELGQLEAYLRGRQGSTAAP